MLHASIPWENRDDAFLVADTQKSDSTVLQLNDHPDSIVRDNQGVPHLEFLYTEEDLERNLRAYITTLLGSLRCRTDVQLADGKALLLKYVSSYVSKMHEAATSEGLYCCDVTGFQAANSFLRTVRPLEPEMVLQLSNVKVCWTDKLTKQFRVPENEEDESLLMWLRNHTTSKNKSKPLDEDRYLVAIKYSSIFNPLFFFQHLLVNFPHRDAQELRHAEETSMPPSIQFFSQAVALQPHKWSTGEEIRKEFQYDGHRDHFLTTIVAYIMALRDILHLWRIRVVDSSVGILTSLAIERLFPLSPFQTTIYMHLMECLRKRKDFPQQSSRGNPAILAEWAKFRVLCGKPGTGKSQVLVRCIHQAVQEEFNVLVCAPLARLAQGYRSLFSEEVEADTIHASFHIPVDQKVPHETNLALNMYDLIVVDEASMISKRTFSSMARSFNCLNLRPVVVFSGNKCQQQPLENVDGRITSTTSILNDDTFTSENAVKFSLYQQFRIQDKEYATFVDLIRYNQPTQEQLDVFQRDLVLCPPGELSDEELWRAFRSQSDVSIMTVSRRGAQRINNIVVQHVFADKIPLSDIPCSSVAESTPILPYCGMKIVITENRDKGMKIVNGKEATIISSHGNTILVRFPENDRPFVYPVTHCEEDAHVTRYPFTPAYARTICKSQGQTITHLIVWLDTNLVPDGIAYVALSRVRRKSDISFLQPFRSAQLSPVNC